MDGSCLAAAPRTSQPQLPQHTYIQQRCAVATHDDIAGVACWLRTPQQEGRSWCNEPTGPQALAGPDNLRIMIAAASNCMMYAVMKGIPGFVSNTKQALMPPSIAATSWSHDGSCVRYRLSMLASAASGKLTYGVRYTISCHGSVYKTVLLMQLLMKQSTLQYKLCRIRMMQHQCTRSASTYSAMAPCIGGPTSINLWPAPQQTSSRFLSVQDSPSADTEPCACENK